MWARKAAFLGSSPFKTQEKLALILIEDKDVKMKEITAQTKEKCFKSVFSVSVNNLGIPAGLTGVLNVLVTVDLNCFYFSFKKKS